MTDQIDELLAEIDDLRERLLRVPNIIGPNECRQGPGD